jgi:hypothetical protein
MAFFELTPSSKGFAYSLDTQKAFRAPLGAASPLWLAFAGATGAGLAFWWMSRLMRPLNLDAFLFKAPATPEPARQLALAPPPEPVAEPVVEAAPEPFVAVEDLIVPSPAVIAEVVAPAPIIEAEPEPAPESAPAPPVASKPALKAAAEPADPKPVRTSAGKPGPKTRG